jgi:hypothetical protein
VISSKQSIPKSKDVRLLCELKKKLVRLVVNDVFGVIEKNSSIFAIERARELGETFFIA